MSESNSIAISSAAVFPVRLLSDERLALLAASGDERAFEQVFRRYQNELYRYCRAILTQHEDAQDALQATMAAALRSLPGSDREVRLRPWLYRVAHNEAITILRRRKHSEQGSVVADYSPSAETEAESRERLRQLVADLDALPDRQRGALTMRELSDMSYKEVGAALGLTPAGARQAVYEARSSLQMVQEGRAMECDQARHAISADDRRILRGRKLRAHIHCCDGCRGFEASIAQRREDFKMLSPALPGAAGAGVLATLLGGEAARTVATSSAVKALATLGAAATIAGGAAGVTGNLHFPGFGNASESAASAGQPMPPIAGARGTRASHTGPETAGAATRSRNTASAGKSKAGTRPNASKAKNNVHGSNGGNSAKNSAGSKAAANARSSNAGGNSATNSAGGSSTAKAHSSSAGGNPPAKSRSSNAGGNPAHATGPKAGGSPAPAAAASNAGGKSAAHSAPSSAGGKSAAHAQSAGHSSPPVKGPKK